jgi:hypothetical protein
LVIGQDTAAKVSFRLPRKITLKSLSIILDNPISGGGSLGLAFNVNGTTTGPTFTMTAGQQTAVFDVSLDVAQDALLCLETIASVAAQNITAIGIGYQILPEGS